MFLEIIDNTSVNELTSARKFQTERGGGTTNRGLAANGVTLGAISDTLDKSIRNLDERDELLSDLDTAYQR